MGLMEILPVLCAWDSAFCSCLLATKHTLSLPAPEGSQATAVPVPQARGRQRALARLPWCEHLSKCRPFPRSGSMAYM